MNFDLDDPLESDDSFFDEPKILGRKSSASKPSEKKFVENLFGPVDKEAKTPHESLTEIVESGLKSKHTVTFDETVTNFDGHSSLKPKDDWLGDSSTKKKDFFEDILSVKQKTSAPAKRMSSLNDILKDSKLSTTSSKASVIEKDVSSTLKQNVSNLDFSSTSRERRRPRKGSSSGIEDALGLFGNDDKKKDVSKSAEDIKSHSSLEKAVPNWLGGSLPILNNAEEAQKTTNSIPETLQNRPEASVIKNPEQSIITNTSTDTPAQINPQSIAKDIQNTYSSLHQQESFLLFSLQLRKYEDLLAEIKDQQKVILDKQQDQFKTLIDDCVLKQQITETNIRLQQDRINNQIQMMISNSFSSKMGVKGDGDDPKPECGSEETLIQAIKQRHNEELFLMEESYRKQITMLEKSNENLEAKLKDEISVIKEILEDKVAIIKEKYEEELTYLKEKLKNMEEDHADEINVLKERHAQIVQELKLDHSAQLDYIKQMKQNEADILDKGKIFSEKIDTSVEMLNINTRTLQEIEQKVIHTHDIAALSRENSIQTKEKEVILMRNTLEKCRQAAEQERTQLLNLVRSLENKLAEQSCNAKEDRWALQQASATLTARAAALEREAEFNRKSIEREREQLKTLKESLLAEQEKMIMQLTEEKLQLSSEKARIEISGKLTNNYEIEKIKFEAETAIQVAKELTEKVTAERNDLFRQKNEVEAMRRRLDEREKIVDDKEVELESLMQEAQKKLKLDKRMLTEAKTMENIYKERLQELQQIRASVIQREKKLAEEKVLLSKERLTLYSSTKSNKSGCVLCKSDKRIYDGVDVQDIYSNKVSDADLYKLKMDLIEDERESEVSKEENISCHNNDHIK